MWLDLVCQKYGNIPMQGSLLPLIPWKTLGFNYWFYNDWKPLKNDVCPIAFNFPTCPWKIKRIFRILFSILFFKICFSISSNIKLPWLFWPLRSPWNALELCFVTALGTQKEHSEYKHQRIPMGHIVSADQIVIFIIITLGIFMSCITFWLDNSRIIKPNILIDRLINMHRDQ